MEPRTTDKDARRLRVLNLMAWIGCVFAAGWGITQFLDPTPGMWKGAAVNAVAALVFALNSATGPVAPRAAAVTTTIFAYAYIFLVISLFGTGSGVPMYYLVLAGLTFVTLGTERILLSAFFGLLGAALIVASEALVPRSTGLYTPTVEFVSFAAVSIATTALLMATVYYALRTAERAEEALSRDNEIIQDKSRQLESPTGTSRISRLGEPRPTPAAPRLKPIRRPNAERNEAGGAQTVGHPHRRGGGVDERAVRGAARHDQARGRHSQGESAAIAVPGCSSVSKRRSPK